MYRPEEGLFVFRLKRGAAGIAAEGLSRRYSAIALLGLTDEGEEAARAVLGGRGLGDLAARLLQDVDGVGNLGDVALTLWATRAAGHPASARALARLRALRPEEGPQPTVELAWALSALSLGPEEPVLRDLLARRLLEAFEPASRLFPHGIGGRRGARSHVCCFADLVYPIQALSHYGRATGHAGALEAARRCAEAICRLQGPAGQWWWHYDRRTGRVVEPYPVYAIHQDAMAPMALLACAEATGADFAEPIRRGLAWIERAPELGGASLLDSEADLLWRKVARREPGKLARYLQAAASGLHPSLRFPGVDLVLPPGRIDYEDRPYHLGWLLHAWPRLGVEAWTGRPTG
jgi:hypothetical protein